jgi:hypothetical protein
MAPAEPTQPEMESPWMVLEVTDAGGPRVLVSELSENRLVFTDDNHWGATFRPGEFVWCVILAGEVIFVEATALNETGLKDFQQFAARHGLVYHKGVSPKQGEA